MWVWKVWIYSCIVWVIVILYKWIRVIFFEFVFMINKVNGYINIILGCYVNMFRGIVVWVKVI